MMAPAAGSRGRRARAVGHGQVAGEVIAEQHSHDTGRFARDNLRANLFGPFRVEVVLARIRLVSRGRIEYVDKIPRSGFRTLTPCAPCAARPAPAGAGPDAARDPAALPPGPPGKPGRWRSGRESSTHPPQDPVRPRPVSRAAPIPSSLTDQQAGVQTSRRERVKAWSRVTRGCGGRGRPSRWKLPFAADSRSAEARLGGRGRFAPRAPGTGHVRLSLSAEGNVVVAWTSLGGGFRLSTAASSAGLRSRRQDLLSSKRGLAFAQIIRHVSKSFHLAFRDFTGPRIHYIQ